MKWVILPVDDLGATIFFQLVSARYERGSIILTSNKSYGDWGSIFDDPINCNRDSGPSAVPFDDHQYPFAARAKERLLPETALRGSPQEAFRSLAEGFGYGAQEAIIRRR